MKIYFKNAIQPNEFEYLEENFESVEYCHHKTEDYEEYRYVKIDSEDIIDVRFWNWRNPFELWLEYV